jgi:hypothetical protein
MEVQLRKTKITASILKQMQVVTRKELFEFKTLGYFVHNNQKRALMTNGTIYKLFTLPKSCMPKEKYLHANYGPGLSSQFETNNELESIQLQAYIETVKKQALEQGQIFY